MLATPMPTGVYLRHESVETIVVYDLPFIFAVHTLTEKQFSLRLTFHGRLIDFYDSHIPWYLLAITLILYLVSTSTCNLYNMISYDYSAIIDNHLPVL